MPKGRVLLVEDAPGIRFAVHDFLGANGYEVLVTETRESAMEMFRVSRPDLVLCDYSLPDGNALELLAHLKESGTYVPFIVLTGHGSIELAVRAIKEGADQFLSKPIELPALLAVLERTLDNMRNRQRQMASRSRESRTAVDPFLGVGPAIDALREISHRVAAAESPILIQGETGTGKSILASWIHRHSPRSEEAFVDLDCAGLSRELLETELFGHKKGSFTGAINNKMGLLEVAHRGTLFLDEIGDIDQEIQPKLLKVVEEQRFRRLGDVHDCSVDVRLIAATHHDLRARAREGKFRADLYFRISTVPVRVPPLRERKEDIPLLAQRILDGFAARAGRKSISLNDDAVAVLIGYAWPGNIRELRNVLERAVLLSEADVLSVRDLQFEPAMQDSQSSFDTELTLDQVERMHLIRVLDTVGGKVDEAAKRLAVPRSSLYQKIKQHGIVLSKV